MTTTGQLVIDREDVHAESWTPLGAYKNVWQKVLWRDPQGRSYAGLLRLDPGAHITQHVHHSAVHHAYVLEGVCGMGGEALGPGSYCFVPAGTDHDVVEVGHEGCTIFYLYLAG